MGSMGGSPGRWRWDTRGRLPRFLKQQIWLELGCACSSHRPYRWSAAPKSKVFFFGSLISCSGPLRGQSRLSLLMEGHSSCNKENACDLNDGGDLTQDNDPNDGGRCWQQGEQKRKCRLGQASHR